MTDSRPAIPAALQRQLFIEAGYRCSIPACGVTAPLEIDHIEEWSKVGEHRYENLIVLCANHHGLKGAGGPRSLTASSLRIVKSNQIEINGRYGDVERRVIDHFVQKPAARRVHLPGDFDLLLSRLLDAELLVWDTNSSGNIAISVPQAGSDSVDHDDSGSGEGYETDDSIGLHLVMRRAYALTPTGVEYVTTLREARSLV